MLFVVNSAVITYNAALKRPAYQSSVYSNTYGTFIARYGNDGSRHTTYNTSPYCPVTKSEANPWWAVDLGHPATIYRVDLTIPSTGKKTNTTGLAQYCSCNM